jgi:hypothetical protein
MRNNPAPKKDQAATRRRRIGAAALNALNGAVAREREGLPRNSPRIKPSLPKLRCLARRARSRWEAPPAAADREAAE